MKKIIILLAVSMQLFAFANCTHVDWKSAVSKLTTEKILIAPEVPDSNFNCFDSEYYAYIYSSGTMTIPYSASSYPEINIPSQGITGLTATTQAGVGDITFTISGYASGVGTAYFFAVVDKQPIQLQVTVKEALSDAKVAFLDCSSSNTIGTFSANIPSIGIKEIPYTGGNGLPYFQQKIISTGVQGLTAVLNSGTLNSGDSVQGKLTYQITGIPSSAGKAYFTVVFGGQTCVFSVDVNDASGSVLALNCSATQASGTFTTGNNSNGTKVVKYIAGNGKPYASQVLPSKGVTGLTAVLTAGVLNSGDGSVTYQISGVPASSGAATFIARIGDQQCTFKVDVKSFSPMVTSLDCNGGTLSGTYRRNKFTSNGSKIINYQGGNESSYKAMTINSTGVTGLTATANEGKLNNGSGIIVFKITGTPTSAGNALFTLNLGDKTCSFIVGVEDETYDANCSSAEDFGYNISENPAAPTVLIIGGQEVRVYRKTTNRCKYTMCYSGFGQTHNGVTMGNACARFRLGYYYVNSMTLVFDKPVNNIGFKSTWYKNNDSAIITTNGGGTLEMKGVVGNSSLITNSSGSYLRTAGNISSGHYAGIAYIISSTQPYTELSLNYDTKGDDVIAAFSKCSAYTEETNSNYGKVSINKTLPADNKKEIAARDITKKTISTLKLYPNPVKNILKISGLKGKGSYQIFNPGGRNIASGPVSEEISIDVSNLEKGIYIITVEDENGKSTHKFLKD